MLILKVTVKENSFQLKPSKRLVATMLNPEKIFIVDPRHNITWTIKRDKVNIWHPLTLLKSFQMYHSIYSTFNSWVGMSHLYYFIYFIQISFLYVSILILPKILLSHIAVGAVFRWWFLCIFVSTTTIIYSKIFSQSLHKFLLLT